MKKLKTFGLAIVIFIYIILLLILFLPISIYRWILSKLVPIIRLELTHIVSTHGSNYIKVNVASEIFVNVVVRFKIKCPHNNKFNFERTKQLFANKLIFSKNPITGKIRFPEFQQFGVNFGGYFFWKYEEAFDINEHIQLYDQDHQLYGQEKKEEGKKHLLTQNELDELEIKFLKTPFKLDKSPWEIIIVESVEKSDQEEPWVLILFKFHHSLSDGYGIFNTLLKCVDEVNLSSPVVSTEKLQDVSESQDRNQSSRILCNACNWLTLPFKGSYDIAKLQQVKWIHTPWDLDSAELSADKVIHRRMAKASKALQFRDLKQIASKYSVSFSAVVIAGFTGGIRRFMLNRGKQLPKYIVGEMPVPVDKHPEGLTNSHCVVSFILPLDCSNLEERLKICENILNEQKKSMESNLTLIFYTISGIIPTGLLNVIKIPYKFPPISFSNFPGPKSPIAFDGQELFDMSYLILSPPVAFAISMLSYNHELRFCCSGDARIFASDEDIREIIGCIENEYKLMMA